MPRAGKRRRPTYGPNPFEWNLRGPAGSRTRRRISGTDSMPMSSTTMVGKSEKRIRAGYKGKKNFTNSEILKQVNNILNPAVKFKFRTNTQNLETQSNEQCVHEFVCNGFDEVNLHWQKLLVNPPNIFNANAVPGYSQSLTETKYIYEGGKYTYTMVNTATQTIYLECRVYGMKVKAVGYGITRSSSPMNAWSYDEANDVYSGDDWFLNSSLNNPVNGPSTLSTVPVTSAGYNRGNAYLNAYGKMDAFKRPKKSSPSLHRLFDLEKKDILVLRPGETVHYEVLMPRFWLDGIKAVPSDSTQIERYTKFLWIMQRGEMVTDTSTDTPKLAPGSTQLTLSVAIEHVFRCPTLCKGNFCIETTNTAGLRGGMDDIADANQATINEETLAESLYSEIGLTNNIG